ncbi:putative quinol--cytochrome-c reductase, Mitochondrial processing peptidase [Helianthus annuus]|nr:putative quinol--cytochrome-c reductase, Mitochondrial processing peptidase [Helianthus annuus]
MPFTSVNQVQLNRAKAVNKSAVLMNLESRETCEFFLKAIDDVTANDIASIAKKLLSSPLTMASHGDGNFLLIIVKLTFFLVKL